MTKTKKEMYAELRQAVINDTEKVAFIDHEVELLDRKSGSPRKPTKTQVENEGFKKDILTALAGTDSAVTIKGLCALCDSIANLSNQRITHMLTDLRAEGKIARTYVKKVAYFSLSCEEAGEGE